MPPAPSPAQQLAALLAAQDSPQPPGGPVYVPPATPTGAPYGDQGAAPSAVARAVGSGFMAGLSPEGFSGMARQGLQAQNDFLQGIDPNTGEPAVTPYDRLNTLAHFITNNIGPQSVGGAASGVEGALGAGPIRAYHGSPYSFDKFDLSKIGTGEGAQAYGHGLYFAGNEDVARSYRDTLSAPVNVRIDPNSLNPQDIAVAFYRAAGKRAGALHAEKMAESNPEQSAAYLKAAEIIRSGDPYAGVSPGHMYEVALHADPASLLDWDKPLAQQPLPVQQSLSQLQRREYLTPDPRSGYDIYDSIRNALEGPGGKAQSAKASELFNQSGIPGIQYLDAGSRASGDGTRNYVMFDPARIEILRKYGLLAAALGGGAVADQQ